MPDINPDRFDPWSFLRNVLARGGAIQQDYESGNLAGYEAFSARMDAAARELADELRPRLGEAERERCAKVCDAEADRLFERDNGPNADLTNGEELARWLAAKIREGGTQ